MSFKSQSLVKIILAASVAIALISGYQAKEWQAQLAQSQASAASAKRNFNVTKEAHFELSEQLSPDESPLSLQEAFSKTVLDIYNLRVRHGVIVTTATPSHGSSSYASPVAALSQDVPNTSDIKGLQVAVRGSYSNYKEFQKYLKALQANPLSIVYLEITDQSFEVRLRIYGKPTTT